MRKVVLAYSGGLDTSVAIDWLRERGWEVIAVAVDVGQPGDLAGAVARAKQLGASDARVVDAKESFVSDFVLPALHMNGLYQARYPLVSALSRPLIAQVLIDVAQEMSASAVAHGCTGKGNDQVRFEVSLAALDPDIEVLAPVRDWGMNRQQTIAYAQARRLPITTTRSSPYSIDENLWGRSIESGVLEDPWHEPPEEVYALTCPPHDAGHSEVEIAFDKGVPSAVDGMTGNAREVIETVGKIAGAAGFGRVDMIEDRLVGIKSREVYEAPAALTLIAAHAELEHLTLERSLLRQKRVLEARWSELVYEGLWFSPLHSALDAFAESTRASVTGEVRLRVAPGGCLPLARRSPFSLYERGLATYEGEDAFRHSDAAGFTRIWGLPAVTSARASRSHG